MSVMSIMPPPKYDAILIGYALCSNGVVGLTSRRIPLVIPRGHDCITLLLGSKELYRDYFDSHRGIYWYSSGLDRTHHAAGPRTLCADPSALCRQIRRGKRRVSHGDGAELVQGVSMGHLHQLGSARPRSATVNLHATAPTSSAGIMTKCRATARSCTISLTAAGMTPVSSPSIPVNASNPATTPAS